LRYPCLDFRGKAQTNYSPTRGPKKMKKSISLLLAVFFSLPALAESQELTIHGLKIKVKNISLFSGTNIVHSFDLVSPVAFPFADGNLFPARERVFLHRNGNISAIVASQPGRISWAASSGSSYLLDCSPRYDPQIGQPMNRIVAFHENRTYLRGCKLASGGARFIDAAGSTITVDGDLDVDPDFNLLFAERVIVGTLLLGEHSIRLHPGSSVGYFKDLSPEFFTPSQGEVFTLSAGEYGRLPFTQRNGKETSTQLLADGRVERGILASGIMHAQLGFSVPEGAGVVFSNEAPYLLTGIIYPRPWEYRVRDHSFFVSSFSWDTEKGYYNVVTATAFTFNVPDSEQKIQVPAGSVVGLDKSWTIIGIRTPNHR